MIEDWLKMAKILIIDDQEYNISLLERILTRAGFEQLHSSSESYQILTLLQDFQPDIVLLDLHMPGMDGMQALQYIREQTGEDNYLPVLILTADITPEAKQMALQGGANDFLTKPFDRTEVILRINNLLKTRYFHLQLQLQNNSLEERVKTRTKELQQAKQEILQLLGRASEYRDDITGQHTQRVGIVSGLIAQELGLSEQRVDMIRMAAPLHDIGKIGISDLLLLKPGRYEPHEFELMKGHTTIGASILEGSYFTVLMMARTIARSHHEKWDGTGYPDGLKGEEIPLEARIVSIADVYDALTHERPYKTAWLPEDALAEIIKQRGIHFDPQIVDVFISLVQQNKFLIEKEEGV